MSLGFGKWKGVPLSEVPLEYLHWVLEQDWVWASTQAMVEAELTERHWQRRFQEAHAAGQRARSQQVPSPKGADPETATAIIAKGYRVLSLEAHPDQGGSHEGMIQLTATKDWLLGVVRKALPGGTRG